MDMEVEFFQSNFTQPDPKVLMDHIQKMTSGEAPYFPETLSLVYGKLFSKAFPQTTFPGPIAEAPVEEVQDNVTVPKLMLRCRRCDQGTMVKYLEMGKYCPGCGRTGFLYLGSIMTCPSCKSWRFDKKDRCRKKSCRTEFM